MTITKAGKKLLQERGIDPKSEKPFKLRKWSELFPNGRFIYYEGDDPQGFAQEMRTKFGLEVEKDNEYWGVHYDADDEGDEFTSYGFYCPVEHLDAIYSNAYPMGS